MRRWVAAAAVLAWVLCGQGMCQAPPPKYIVLLSPTIFQVSLPATAAHPESHCYMWVRLGGLYDAEVACYVGGAFTGRLDTAPAGQGFDGGFRAPGGGFVRWATCDPASVDDAGCGSKAGPPPAALTKPMYFELSAQLGDGSPAQLLNGYY